MYIFYLYDLHDDIIYGDMTYHNNNDDTDNEDNHDNIIKKGKSYGL